MSLTIMASKRTFQARRKQRGRNVGRKKSHKIALETIGKEMGLGAKDEGHERQERSWFSDTPKYPKGSPNVPLADFFWSLGWRCVSW